MSWPPEQLRWPDGAWCLEDADLARMSGASFELVDLLVVVHEQRASSLDLVGTQPPVVMVGGTKIPVGQQPLGAEAVLKLLLQALPLEQRYALMKAGALDYDLEHPHGRCRVRARVGPQGIQVRVEPTAFEATAREFEAPRFNLDDLLSVAQSQCALCLDLEGGSPPTVVLQGQRIPIGTQPLSAQDTFQLLAAGLPTEAHQVLLAEGLLETILQHDSGAWELKAWLEGEGVLAHLVPLTAGGAPQLPTPAPSVPAGEPLQLLASPRCTHQVALFPELCVFYQGETVLGLSPLPHPLAPEPRPFLDEEGRLFLTTTEGVVTITARDCALAELPEGRVELSADGSQWLYCLDQESRGLLGVSRLHQLVLHRGQTQLVFTESKAAPVWAVSPNFEYLLHGEPRKHKLALQLIGIAEQLVLHEFELAPPQALHVDDEGLMLLDFGHSWVLARPTEGGRLETSQWEPPPGTLRGWPLAGGAIAVTSRSIYRIDFSGEVLQRSDSHRTTRFEVVRDLHYGARVMAWEDERLVLHPAW